jgi:hypothetical protein
LQVRVAPDPQLVVCKGIVADRIQKIRTNRSVLEWRCSRASYGTACKVLFDPRNPQHFGQPTQKDAFDGKLYIPDCISWFIKQVKIHTRECCQEADLHYRANPCQLTTLSSSHFPVNALQRRHSTQTRSVYFQ